MGKKFCLPAPVSPSPWQNMMVESQFLTAGIMIARAEVIGADIIGAILLCTGCRC